MANIEFQGVSPAVLARDYVAQDTMAYYTRAHGVLSDGSAHDLNALNALIQAVSTAGGGRIVFPPHSNTLIHGPIVAASNVALEGSPDHTSIITLSASVSGSGMITDSGGVVTNFTARDLVLDGNVANFAQLNSGIWFSQPGFTDITVDRVWVRNLGYYGIAFIGDSTRATVSRRVRITGCRSDYTNGDGIICQWGIDDALIDRCEVTNYSLVNSGLLPVTGLSGITAGRFSYNPRVTNNHVDGTNSLGTSSHGISLDHIYGGGVCTGNVVVNPTGLGIEIEGCKDTTVHGNGVRNGARSGIQFTGDIADGTVSANVTVAANTIVGCAGSGINNVPVNVTAGMATPASVLWTPSTVYATNVVMVQGNRLYLATAGGTSASTIPGTLGATTTAGTVTDGTVTWTDQGATNSNITITGNAIRGCAGSGVEMHYTHQFTVAGNAVTGCAKSGIRIDSNCNLGTVSANEVDGNNTAAGADDGGLRIVTLSNTPHLIYVGPNGLRGNASANYYVTEGAGSRLDDRFIAGDTTPSVGFNDVFYTANSSGTSITKFDDPGGRTRLITVFVNDANTTFVHQASSLSNTLRLVGGTNYTPAAGTMLQFVSTPDGPVQWREVSRSATG